MAHDIPSFLREIDKIGQLKRIEAPVSLDLEITEIADRVIKRAGPALLFNNVRQTPDVPVAIGLYGSHERLALGLHDTPENIAGRITDLISTRPPQLAGWHGENGFANAADDFQSGRQARQKRPGQRSDYEGRRSGFEQNPGF